MYALIAPSGGIGQPRPLQENVSTKNKEKKKKPNATQAEKRLSMKKEANSQRQRKEKEKHMPTYNNREDLQTMENNRNSISKRN